MQYNNFDKPYYRYLYITSLRWELNFYGIDSSEYVFGRNFVRFTTNVNT